MGRTKILVVDDEPDMLHACATVLSDLRIPDVEIEVATESDPLAAAEGIRRDAPPLLLLDVRMPKLDGLGLLKLLRDSGQNTCAIVMTGYPEVETAVLSMRLGAFDYLLKPFTNEQLRIAVARAIEFRRLREENRFLREKVVPPSACDDLVGASREIRDVYLCIDRAAAVSSTVLILGETGTGKGMVARAVHRRSAQASANFVVVECGSLPEPLMESELFGHAKGAFTGAQSPRKGLCEFARGGTLFLDEVCELPLSLQVKLLGVLEDREFRPVGGNERIRADFRVIAATNRDIEEEVREKRFRADLYFRLNVLRVMVPPLRDRDEDIPLLALHFLQEFKEKEKGGHVPSRTSARALDVLRRYPWPGNVRELRNVTERSASMCRLDEIDVGDLPPELSRDASAAWKGVGELSFFDARRVTSEQFEKDYFRGVLTRARGNVTLAAQYARMPRNTFYRYLQKYGINPHEFKV